MTSNRAITVGQTKIYTWTVPNFIKLLENKGLNEMQEQITVNNSMIKVKMRNFDQDHDIIGIYFFSPNSVFLKLILTIFVFFIERSIVLREYHLVEKNKWQYLATFSKRDIDSISGDTFLSSCGSISLKFVTTNDLGRSDEPIVPQTQLSRDLENLLKNGIFSDVTMKSVEGNEYKVHKAVLASRSDVLKAHFEHNTIECQTNIVQSPLEGEVLKEVLNFIYSGKAPRVDVIPERLLAAADYYQLSKLKSLCEEALHKRLTVENAIETLELADLYSAKILKRLTLEFIKDGHAKLITRTEGWTNVKSELIRTIYEYVMADEED